MSVVVLVLAIIVLMTCSWLAGCAYGIGSEVVDHYTWPHSKNLNGWLIRPFKHLYCGAVYGHLYVKDTPEAGGWVGCTCKRCGKLHTRRVK